MEQNELLYVASTVLPHDKILEADASYKAGFLGSPFYQHPNNDWLEHEAARLREADQLHFVRTKHSAESARRSLGDNRLVQGRKSPTAQEIKQKQRFEKRLRVVAKSRRGNESNYTPQAHNSFDALYSAAEQGAPSVCDYRQGKVSINKAPSSVRLMHREWSGQHKIQVINETSPSDAPEANVGERFTKKLTKRSVGKIFESSAYVATCHGGFTTFLTLTFTPEQRMKITKGGVVQSSECTGDFCPVDFKQCDITGDWLVVRSGESTIGREISRFLDAAKKMFSRGWTTESGERVPGIKGDFHYIWVAEMPANDDGEPNPHAHLLMNWQVEKKHFKEWAKHLESLWGNGFGHLERIKHSKGAGAYIIKAVGYAAKGENADQGLIRGNRYNIARCSRAPAWECLESFETHNMTAIIKELGYKLAQWRKPLERHIRRCEKKLKDTARATDIAKKRGDDESQLKKLQARYIRLERSMLGAKKTIKERGVFASTSNRFSLTFEGEEASQKLRSFLLWATGARNWSAESRNSDQSALREAADALYEDEFLRWVEKRHYWQDVIKNPPDIVPQEEIKRVQSYNFSQRELYINSVT